MRGSASPIRPPVWPRRSDCRASGWVTSVKELEKRGLLKHVGERRKRNCVERLVQATARHYTIAPEALGRLGLDPRRVRDRFSSAYLAAMLTRAAREVASLQERAERAGQRLATLTLETEVPLRLTRRPPGVCRRALTTEAVKDPGGAAPRRARAEEADERFRFVIARLSGRGAP